MLISQQNNKEAVISGTSGVGKSILACKFALKNSKSFPGGIYSIRVNEEKFENSKNFLAEIAKELLADLGIKPDKEINDKQIIKNMKGSFARREALLIFDNVGTDRIRNLFPGGECAIIVTTTKKGLLHQLTDDQKIELFLPNEVNSSVLQEKLINFSLNLLKNLVGENRKREIEENSLTATKILDLIGYLPLAIKLISPILENCFDEDDLEAFLENLENEKSRIEHLYDIKNEKGSDLWYAFALALKGLKEEEKKIFVCLGACAKTGFSLELITRTAEFNSTETAKTYLKKLASNYLVKEYSDYFMPRHNLIHDFAKFLLEEEIGYEWINISDSLNIDDKNIKNNHANYLVELVNQNYYLPIPDKIYIKTDLQKKSEGNISYKDLFEKIHLNSDNLIVASKWLAEPDNFNENSYCFILSSILRDFFYQYRNQKQYSDLVEKFYKTAEEQEEQKDGKNYIELKFIDRDSFSKKEDETNAFLKKIEQELEEKLLSKNECHSIKRHKLKCLKTLFWLYIDKRKDKSLDTESRNNNFKQAEDYLKNIEQLFAELDENIRYLEAENINVLRSRFHFYKAEAYDFKPNTKTDLEEALKFAKKTLDDFEHQPNEILFLMDMRLGQLGEILLHSGKFFKQENPIEAKQNFEDAKKYLKDSLKISEALKHGHGISIVLKNLGKTYKQLMVLEDDILNKEFLFEQSKNCFLQSYFQDKRLIKNKNNQNESIAELYDLYISQNKDLYEIINKIVNEIAKDDREDKKEDEIKKLINQACYYLKPIKGKVTIFNEWKFIFSTFEEGRVIRIIKGFITFECLPGKNIYF